MTAQIPPQAIIQHLFAVPETTVYAILDGASVPELPQTLERFEVESECLFRGDLEPGLALVAPYLVRLQRRTCRSLNGCCKKAGASTGVFSRLARLICGTCGCTCAPFSRCTGRT